MRMMSVSMSLCGLQSMYSLLVERRCFPFFDGDRVLRTVAKARAESVAVNLVDQPGLAVHDLDRAFRAFGYSQTAAGAFLLVDDYKRSFHRFLRG